MALISALRRPPPCIFCQFSSKQSLIPQALSLQLSWSSRPSNPARPRPLSTTSRRHAATKRAALPPRPLKSKTSSGSTSNSKSRLTSSNQPSSTNAVYSKQGTAEYTYASAADSYRQTLSQRHGATVLYTNEDASSGTAGHMAASRAVSAFCVAYGAYNLHDAVLTPHPGLWAGIPVLMGGVCSIMILGGAWVGLSARRIVSRLEVLPVSLAQRVQQSESAGASGLMVRVYAKKLFSSASASSSRGSGELKGAVTVPLEAVTLSTKIASSSIGTDPMTGRRLTLSEAAEARRKETAEREAAARGGIVQRLAARVSRGLASFGRIFSREGFVKVYIHGQGVWRLDVRNGFVVDGGVPLDRLLKVR